MGVTTLSNRAFRHLQVRQKSGVGGEQRPSSREERTGQTEAPSLAACLPLPARPAGLYLQAQVCGLHAAK